MLIYTRVSEIFILLSADASSAGSDEQKFCPWEFSSYSFLIFSVGVEKNASYLWILLILGALKIVEFLEMGVEVSVLV